MTPDREIAWNDISRISNSEMKELMIDAVNCCDRLLGAIFASDAIVDALKDWNDPNWYDQLTLEDVDQLDEPTRKKGQLFETVRDADVVSLRSVRSQRRR